ncbi:auxin-induced protein 6b [Phtheirospermum japonicum]|uniref:Auxin-induced protein 6b n=1 Tax=Phtheirospermum japonicum TaxID=374723 RepID=A0A830BGZ3_9LAMI|nr:auxin-induced protein 6b [Phtheirospermum japonicum]
MIRFVVPLHFLKNPLFQQLLDKAAEEHGFHDTNRITLPCDVAIFQSLVAILSE